MPKTSTNINESVVRAFRFPKKLWEKYKRVAKNNRRTTAAQILLTLEENIND